MIERQTAKKVRIWDLMNGEFVKKEGFEPNFIKTPLGEEISRARILGTIVTKFVGENERYAFITVDDGTDTIRLKLFKTIKPFESFNIGDIIDVIGKVKEYEGERYLIPEIIRKVDDPNYEILRRLELVYKEMALKRIKELIEKYKGEDLNEIKKELIENYNFEKSLVEIFLKEGIKEISEIKKQVLEIIESSKNGISYSEILKRVKGKKVEIENAIDELLNEGICYEPSPGKIKKV